MLLVIFCNVIFIYDIYPMLYMSSVIFVMYNIIDMPYVMDEYVNMGAKRNAKTSGLQPDVIQ